MKTCFKCKESKPLDAFYKHPRMSDGRLGKCIECTRKDVSNNREKRLEYYREYDRQRGFRPSSALKTRARNLVNHTLERKPCEMCGEERSDAHHDDYSKPLEVRWLCRKHHMELHRKYA